ncbi:MAG: universal stress protein [Thiohalocapsa sp.]|jgi:nucleotide-binding universal stress UspA family protein|nr:universal stress protein [Thiohalocapsa sp.]MCF7991426.1 universal stress protein [Thiohalocapsa sp.]
MPVKTILLSLCETDNPGPALEMALGVAQRFDAHLDILYVMRNPSQNLHLAHLGLSKHLRQTVLKADDRNVDTKAGHARELFEFYCAESGIPIVEAQVGGHVSAAWQQVISRADSTLAVRGRLSDLIILPGPIPVAPPPAVAEAALKSTGRPVLIMPRRVEPTIGSRVGIGWNGSAQAAHAVGAAMAYLKEAEEVIVYTCQHHQHTEPTPAELVKYLGWHGVTARMKTVQAHDPHVGEALLASATEDKINLLIVGAYSRSRLRQLILGGVTEHVMTSAEMPVFMLH